MSLNDTLAAEIARLETEVERKRLEQQIIIQAMENEIAHERMVDDDDEEEELIVLTAPKRNWKHIPSSPRSVHSETTPQSPHNSLHTPGKAPVRRSLLFQSVVQAASERGDSSERIEELKQTAETKEQANDTTFVSPGWKNKSPVRRSVFLKSVVAASELRASATHDTSLSSSDSEHDDDDNPVSPHEHEPTTTTTEDEGLDAIEAEIRALEESAERTKQAIEAELEKRRRQEAGIWQEEEEEEDVTPATVAEQPQQLQSTAADRRQEELQREQLESERQMVIDAEREAEAQGLKLEEEEIKATQAAVEAQQQNKKMQKAELQRQQLEEEIRKVEMAAAEASRKKSEALERQKMEDEAKALQVASEKARQKREEELSKLHADHEQVIEEHTGVHREQPRLGAFFQGVEDEASRLQAEHAKKLEQERLQAEIRQMELELQKRRAASSGASVTSRSSMSSKTSKTGKTRKMVSKKSLERQKLQQEIARMEAEIGNAVSSKSLTSDASVTRPAFLAGIAEAAASREQSEVVSEETGNRKLESPISVSKPIASSGAPARPAFLSGIAEAAAAREKRTDVISEETNHQRHEGRTSVSKPIARSGAPARPAFLSGIAEAAAAREKRSDASDETADGTHEIETIASKPMPNSTAPARPSFLSGIAEAAAAREKRVIEEDTVMTIGTLATHPSTDTEASPTSASGMPMRPNLLFAISGAAAERQKRLEATGGELQMREVEPEVEDTRKNTPQPSFALAEMVSKKAQDREKRLEAGGEKKMTKIKEKAEYKSVFSNVALEAASMGRLTRLNEHTVEAVAQEKTKQQEWKSKGLLAIDWRSTHMAIIHQAAARGNERKMREHVVSNKSVAEEEEWEAKEVDRGSSRLNQLLELNKKVGTGTAKVDELVMGLREENQIGESMLIRPMYAYSKIEEIKLPKPLPPSIDVKKAKQKATKMEEEAVRQHHPMSNISAHVAEVVWERRARLNRPGSMPKVRQACDCPYCGTASPYQTFAYREAEKRHKHEMKHRMETTKQMEEELAVNNQVDPPKQVLEVQESVPEKTPTTPVTATISAGDKLRKKLETKKTPIKEAQHRSLVAKNNTPVMNAPASKAPVATTTKQTGVTTKTITAPPKTTATQVPPKAAQPPEPMAVSQGCACVIM